MSQAAPREVEGELRLWAASFGLVLAAHGLLALGLLRWERPLEGATIPPAVIIDMPAAPVAPPQPAPDLPTPEPPAPVAPEELTEKLPPPEPKIAISPVEPPAPVTPEELIEKLELPEVPEVPEPAVSLPPPAPRPKPRPPERRASAPKPLPAPAEKLPPAPLPAAPTTPAVVARPSPELRVQFQALLLAHLERHMRYPRAAQLRNQQGIAHLHLVIDRDGRIIQAEIVRSSGHAVLDEEVMSTLERARPLPALPPELGLERLDVIVPMQFKLRGRS